MTRQLSRNALFVLACLALVAPARAAETGAADKVDFSDPKPVAVAFAKAMVAGDAKAVRATAVGTDEEFKTVEALGAIFPAIKKFKAACDAKFGPDNLLSKNMAAGQDPAAEVEKSDVKVDGDTATVTNKNKPDEKEPMKLKKVEGKWKVALSSMGKDAGGIAKKAPAVAKVFGDAAADIEAGKYQNAQDAMLGLAPKMAEAMK